MRILYAAMKYDYGRQDQGFSFEHNNFFDCLRGMGHDILYFDFPTLMRQVGRAAMNRRLEEVVDAEKPDLLFAVLCDEELDRDIVARISRSGKTVTLNWFCDDHWRFENYSRFWAPCFNWVVTTAASTLPKYERMGYQNVIKSQWGCNHFQYCKLDRPLKYDATFVGMPHGDRRYLVQALRQAGIDVKCWGTGWESGRLGQKQMIEVFNQSRINLNFSNSSTDGRKSSTKLNARALIARAANFVPFGATLKSACCERKTARQAGAPAQSLAPQIKGRNFEVPGCGGLLLTGRAEDIGSYYEVNREIACFNDAGELVEQCRRLLADEPLRANIAQAGYQRTLHDHTYAHRFTEIFARLGLPHEPLDAAFAGRAPAGELVELAR